MSEANLYTFENPEYRQTYYRLFLSTNDQYDLFGIPLLRVLQ